MYDGPIIDADIHHNPRSVADILEYLPSKWHGLVDQTRTPGGGTFAGSATLQPPRVAYRRLGGTWRTDTYPAVGGPPGSDYETLRKDVLDRHNIECVAMHFDQGQEAGHDNIYLANAIVRAMNDWTRERWLDDPGDSRICASVLVPTQLPEEAAAEIRRVGAHSQIVAALLAYNSLAKPFGHPLYHPIYEAASELDLPLVIHIHGNEGRGSLAAIQAGGLPNSCFERVANMHQPTLHHITSMIVHGVFEKYPTLRVGLVEVGLLWVPWFLASLDSRYEMLRAESTWVRRRPSEYFAEHFFLTTQPLEVSDRGAECVEQLRLIERIEEMLCFSSDYPHWDGDEPRYIASVLPRDWHANVFSGNARRFLRLPGKPKSDVSQLAARVG